MCAMGKKSTERMYGEERRGKMPFYFHGGNRIREREKGRREEREGGRSAIGGKERSIWALLRGPRSTSA